MERVTVIVRQGQRILASQDVDEDQVSDLLDAIDRDHRVDGLTIHVVPHGLTRVMAG